MDLPFRTELYKALEVSWPMKGKVILYSPNVATDDSIILYQAYNDTIAKYAVSHQTFEGCPDFSTTRMTWLKPNFCWMMYRSGWATKPNQNRILAVTVKRDHFNDILRKSVSTSKQDFALKNNVAVKSAIDVRLQWDPDHDPIGEKLERRAIQIGIRGNVLDTFLSEYIVNICDITAFVHEQRKYVEEKRLDLLRVPAEQIYSVDDELLRGHIQLTDSSGEKIQKYKMTA